MTGPRRRVTLSDVAKAAGVDVSLVSRVLRGQGIGESADTRTRIRTWASKLGYEPNAIARSLRSARAGAYALAIPTFNNPVYAEIISGAEAAATELGYVILTGSANGWERGDWQASLGSGRVDGVLIAGGLTIDPARLTVPYLMVNRSAAVRSVVLADEHAAEMAVDHLWSQGHRRIAFLAGPDSADTAQRRFNGYRAALRAHQRRFDPRLVVKGDYTADGSARSFGEFLDRGRSFTAVVVANVVSAIGAIHAVWLRGLRVPDHLSIVAIHDADLAAFLTPPLTVVTMPLAELGARAIRMLATLPADQPVHEVVDQPMKLIVRGSTGPVREQK